jgi:peptidoglycan hydrolase-like protein with peptidoglycan-binding domain
MILATPTCNGVRNWFNAAVPDWTTTGTVDCNMVRGTNSAAVRQLQRSMNVCYQEHLVLDGDFGGNTQAALIRTQKRAGTPADGQYGPNTRKAMRHESNDVPGTCTRVP